MTNDNDRLYKTFKSKSQTMLRPRRMRRFFKELLIHFRALLNSSRQFFNKSYKREDIFVVPILLPKRFRMVQTLVPRCTTTKKVDTSKSGRQEKDEKEVHPEGEETIDDKEATYCVVR